MNHYSFNVGIYDQKGSTNPHSLDILVQESKKPKLQRMLSVTKLLGGFTARKAGFIAIGGVFAVGCIIRFLRNKRKRLRKEKPPLSKDEIARSSRSNVCIKLGPFSDLDSVEQAIDEAWDGDGLKTAGIIEPLTTSMRDKTSTSIEVTGEDCISSDTHKPLDEAPASDDQKPGEITKSRSNMTRSFEDHTTPKCNCRSEDDTGSSARQAASSRHPCCTFSSFLALLALHKAFMIEREVSTARRQYKNRLCEPPFDTRTPNGLVFNPGTRSSTTTVRKHENSYCTDTFTGEDIKKPALLRSMEVNSPGGENRFTAVSGLGNRACNAAEAPPQTQQSPFDAGCLAIRSSATGPEKKRDNLLKGDFSDPQESPLNQNQRPNHASLASCAGFSNFRTSSQDVRNHIQLIQRPSDLGTPVGHSKEDSSSVGFGSQACSNSRSPSRGGKPRRRGTGRSNPPHRRYVDLDNPKSIAS